MDRPDPPAEARVDFEGPPVRASLEVMESHPPQYAVLIEVDAPTLGWELATEGVAAGADATVVTLELTEPGPDEIVAQVVQTRTARVALDHAPTVVQVRISRWQRDVHYLVSPGAKLAAVVTR